MLSIVDKLKKHQTVYVRVHDRNEIGRVVCATDNWLEIVIPTCDKNITRRYNDVTELYNCSIYLGNVAGNISCCVENVDGKLVLHIPVGTELHDINSVLKVSDDLDLEVL